MVGYKFCANLHKIFELYNSYDKKVKTTPLFSVVEVITTKKRVCGLDVHKDNAFHQATAGPQDQQ